MIRIICPGCGSKLNAKDELVGQTRKCPKCAQPVLITAPAAEPVGAVAAEAAGPTEIRPDSQEGLPPPPPLPTRLNRESHYLICDRTQLVAAWQNDGRGWMLRGGAGFLSAKRNRQDIPAHGEFQLVELKFTATPDGKRLRGIASYQLVTRWALTALADGDDPIVTKITGQGCLNRDQKNAVRQALREQCMRPIWADAADVLEYLGNADYHSPGVG